VPRITLRIRASPRDRPVRREFLGPRITIGRTSQSDLQVDHELVSRVHGELQLASDRWLFRDLGSRNGSYLSGRRIEGVELRPGDRIRLGIDGPEIRVVRLERTAPGRPLTQPPPAAQPRVWDAARRPPGRTPASGERRRLPYLPLAGLIAGVLLAVETFGAGFPYALFVHPPEVAIALLPQVLPGLASATSWLVVLGAGLHFGLVGCCLQHRRGWPLLVLLIGLHLFLLHAGGFLG
jgi:hypothetical protein